MGKKFCKIIENEAGDQLLLRLSPSDEEDRADLSFHVRFDEGIAEVTLGGLEWDKAEEVLDSYSQEDGDRILSDPVEFLKASMGYS